MNDYQRSIDYWNSVFSGEGDGVPSKPTTDNAKLDDAIRWLCEASYRIFDFGCGNGVLLIYCALNGTKSHLGIDLSEQAIVTARKKAANMSCGAFEFRQGGMETLADIPDDSCDAAILSNVVDNLYPEDAMILLHECTRILNENGKLFVKLNPYLTQKQIVEWNIKTISGNLLDDGILLWNNTNEQWRGILSKHFEIYLEEEIYYPEHGQTNRLFCLINRRN